MDVGTLIGLGGAFGLVLIGIVLGGCSLKGYIDPPSMVIVCGGSLMALLIAYPVPKVKELAKVYRKLLFPTEVDGLAAIKQLVEMCMVVRREGLLALDSMTADITDPFLAKGVQFVVDGTDPEMTRAVLETEIAARRQRHNQGRGMLEFLGAIAPAFGMIGTLIGLVGMLAQLDPATLGPKMAVALLTTFYGSLLANVLFLPAARKLQDASERELLVSKIMVEGLLGIQAGENPRNLEDKLKAFLPPALRTASEPTAGGGRALSEAA